MSLLDDIQNQQKKRQARELSVVEPGQPSADDSSTHPAKTTPNASPAATTPAMSLNAQIERQTRQLGYRVSLETLHAFEAYRDKLNALARKRGVQKPSAGELTDLALQLLMTHDPRAVLGLK